MKIKGIALYPPKNLENEHGVTPELLASCLAKYSRSNKGIDSILKSIDWENTDQSVDTIFKFIDYGHASIGGLTGGIAIVVDSISMFLAFKIFEIAQLCDGQESSTRYIRLNKNSLPHPDEIGIPSPLQEQWLSLMDQSFILYNNLYQQLENNINENPHLLKIPDTVDEKVKIRIRKNYALDRCRYLIPFATQTNAAYIMTSRVWAETLKELESYPFPEFKKAAQLIRSEIEKFTPRLIKHSYKDDASTFQAHSAINYCIDYVKKEGFPIIPLADAVHVSTETNYPTFLKNYQSTEDGYKHKKNRYSFAGHSLKRIMVRFAWNNIALAELRDLNRHRSGHRFTPLIPVGFYHPQEIDYKTIEPLLVKQKNLVEKIIHINKGQESLFYTYLLGTQTPFEHSTHADKFIYEVELRTGLGAHFRYAQHLKNCSDKFLEILPQYKDCIHIGSAEPE